MPHKDKIVILEGGNVFLSDWRHWNEQMQELDTWCADNRVTRMGMFLTFPDRQTLTAFVLQWT